MNGILLPAYIENIATRKDKTVKLTLGTQELSPMAAGQLFQYSNKLVVAYLSEKDIPQRELDQVDQVNPEFGTKTQSQRLRAVFYKLWEQDKKGYQTFDNYYRAQMDLIIEHYKTKIQ
jgi:hypothetical protein